MNRRQRFNNVLIGLFMLSGAAILAAAPEEGYIIVLAVLTVALLIKGIQMLIYYFSMARHMVGGKMILYEGMIITDVGIFAITITDVPKVYIMLFLIGVILFDGVIYIMRAGEERKLANPRWKIKMGQGVVSLILALLCCCFINSGYIITYIYGASLIYGAMLRFYNAFRRTSVRVEKL